MSLMGWPIRFKLVSVEKEQTPSLPAIGDENMKTMAALQILLWLILLQLDYSSLVNSSNSQPSACTKTSFLPVTVGQNVTLNCSYVNALHAKLYWFKQSLDNTQSMTSSYFDEREFYGEFANSHRFALDNDNGKNNLEIANVQISDSAVYHCINCVAHQIQFLATVNVMVKDSNSGLRIDQRALETVEPGRSLRLDCSVHFGTCAGQRTVHWFKRSEESAPGVLYSHGGGNSDQCGRNTDSPTNSRVYSLHIHNVSSEQTGSYYCAVAACGQVLFGNGTMIKIAAVDPVVTILAGALAFTIVLVVLLLYSLCLMKRKYKRQHTVPISEDSFPLSTGNAENQQDSLHYAALSVNAKSRRPRNSAQTDCVYSGVRQHN